ncbi:hypothetical protein I2I05_11935 [Hymenobacter sp. BT683]|uniref:Uncharacterized protein n=1 Tax=Hymenobacter jeongseonensis TaxID=2791027 RepID=A0ABS0IIF0_9BACT|nr:hypothetical protein [Hymenobacter jeongseonensis]MBF9238106.1 hypothetical protein [Hymenobacter jeongseonensis]
MRLIPPARHCPRRHHAPPKRVVARAALAYALGLHAKRRAQDKQPREE